jgi:hypothetical protein
MVYNLRESTTLLEGMEWDGGRDVDSVESVRTEILEVIVMDRVHDIKLSKF